MQSLVAVYIIVPLRELNVRIRSVVTDAEEP